jgi:hypothetical protein
MIALPAPTRRACKQADAATRKIGAAVRKLAFSTGGQIDSAPRPLT